MIIIDLKILDVQYNAIVNSNIDKELKEGILNLLSSISWELKLNEEVTVVEGWEN